MAKVSLFRRFLKLASSKEFFSLSHQDDDVVVEKAVATTEKKDERSTTTTTRRGRSTKKQKAEQEMETIEEVVAAEVNKVKQLSLYEKCKTRNIELTHYAEAKKASTHFQTTKNELFKAFSKAELGTWVKKPMEQDDFQISIGDTN